MSALYVRNMVRSWLNDPSLDVPFFDTVNLEQNPQVDQWVTAEFETTLRDKLSFCEWKEEGEVLLVFTGVPGVGDGALLAAAEKDVKTLLAFRDPTRQLLVTAVQGIQEYSGGSANVGYQIEIILDYEYTEI